MNPDETRHKEEAVPPHHLAAQEGEGETQSPTDGGGATSGDEWQLLSARGQTSRPVLVDIPSRRHRRPPVQEETAGATEGASTAAQQCFTNNDKGSDGPSPEMELVDHPGTEGESTPEGVAAPAAERHGVVPSLNLPAGGGGAFGQQHLQEDDEPSGEENEMKPEGEGRGMMSRHDSCFADDEFFESEGFFSTMPASARGQPNASCPSSARGATARPSTLRVPQGVSLSPRKEDTAGKEPQGRMPQQKQGGSRSGMHRAGSAASVEASPGQSSMRGMPTRGISALESFFLASDADLFGMESTQQSGSSNPASPPSSVGGAPQFPPVCPSPQVQSISPTQPHSPMPAKPGVARAPTGKKNPKEEEEEGVPPLLSDSPEPTTDPQTTGTGANEPSTADENESVSLLLMPKPSGATATAAVCFTWFVLATTSRQSTSTSVLSSCAVGVLGLGALWRLLKHCYSPAMSSSSSSSSLPRDTEKAGGRTTDDNDERVRIAYSQWKQGVSSVLHEVLEFTVSVLAGNGSTPPPETEATNQMASEIFDRSKQETSSSTVRGTTAMSKKDDRRHQRGGQLSRYLKPVEDELLRVPPIIRWVGLTLSIQLLVVPLTQLVTLGTILRSSAVFVALYSVAVAALSHHQEESSQNPDRRQSHEEQRAAGVHVAAEREPVAAGDTM